VSDTATSRGEQNGVLNGGLSRRDATTQGLVRVHELKQRGDVAALIAELTSPVEDNRLTVRGAAATALGQLRAPEAVEPLAARLHEDPNSRVRARAAVAISKIGGDEATDHLLTALEDPAPHVRWQAAYNLGRTGNPRAVEPLIALLRSEDDILRRAAAAALGRLGDQRARDALLAARAADSFWRRGLYNKALRSVTNRRGERAY
jgi:HEAT repeat protein